jgi:polyisoprenoid-binding protein YceI
MVRRYRWLLVGLALLAAPFVGTFVYLNVIRDDPPPPLSLDDLTTTTGATPTSSDGIEGTWTVAEGSVVGYRVQETLFGQSSEAVGRSKGIGGSLVIQGTRVTGANFEVDMATFASDETRRDGQFNGRIMDVAQFPTAGFVLTTPIELGRQPADGVEVQVEAIGDLSLHGVTRPVSIPLTAKRTGDTLAVSGAVTVTFADYGIDNPSGGPASVGDTGDLEILLVVGR